jgi:hypothetical protein
VNSLGNSELDRNPASVRTFSTAKAYMRMPFDIDVDRKRRRSLRRLREPAGLIT